MLIIGITGGSGSGKTTVVDFIVRQLPNDSVTVISLDSYYKDNKNLTEEQRKQVNFDSPSSFEFDLLNKHLDELQEGKTIQMPIYHYVTCSRDEETIPVKPCDVIIVEGIMVFANEELRNRLDIKVFVDTDADDRLIRIINRDIVERGRSYRDVLEHYQRWVKPMHQAYIEPAKKFADIVLPEGGKNVVGIDVLLSKIKLLIHENKEKKLP
ncbi:MAG: uridine kinase [Bacteroidales bacterium]|nr:uridine kinase [Bacteroidales bacterium]MBR6491187.1 uridine kinase [Bacteroidales bacterium]